jgi:hypothetical protein
VKTVAQGYLLTHSWDVVKVGGSYAKLAVAPSTLKVGEAYARAAIRGNGHALDQLGHTNLVKQVGRDFANLSNSLKVKKFGDKFSQFGQSVAGQFNGLFLNDHPAPAVKTPGAKPASR